MLKTWTDRLFEALRDDDKPMHPIEYARRADSQIVHDEGNRVCADAFELEAHISSPYGVDVAKRVLGATPALSDAEKADALISRMLLPRNMMETLGWLSESEVVALRQLIFEYGGRLALDGANTEERAGLIPIRGWCYLVERGSRFEYVVASQAMELAQSFDWDRTLRIARDSDRLLDLAGLLTWCSGAIEKDQLWQKFRERYPESRLGPEDVGLCVVHGACRGRTRSRLVADISRRKRYIVDGDLLRLADKSYYVVELSPLNRQLAGFIDECLERRDEMVPCVSTGFKSKEELYTFLACSPAVDCLRNCLCRRAPEAEDLEPWLTRTLAKALETARYAESVEVMAEICKIGLSGAGTLADREVGESLLELLDNVPRWGCRLKADDIHPCAPFEPVEFIPASFRYARG